MSIKENELVSQIDDKDYANKIYGKMLINLRKSKNMKLYTMCEHVEQVNLEKHRLVLGVNNMEYVAIFNEKQNFDILQDMLQRLDDTLTLSIINLKKNKKVDIEKKLKTLFNNLEIKE